MPLKLRELSTHLDIPREGRVLDYGCADVPYRDFFADSVDYVTADLPGNPAAILDLNADGSVPAANDSFDVVMSTQVLEHVDSPDIYLDECYRVLKPGGQLMLSTHGVFIYHPDPVDYWRWTCDGLRREVKRPGFEIKRFDGIIGLAATGIQLFQDGIYERVPGFVRKPLAWLMQKFMAIADRLEGDTSRNLNATVFGLIAVKPADG